MTVLIHLSWTLRRRFLFWFFNPGELIFRDPLDDSFRIFDFPLEAKIGDLIGLNLGYLQEISDILSDFGSGPGISHKIRFFPDRAGCPLAGIGLAALGGGLLLLVGVRVGHRS